MCRISLTITVLVENSAPEGLEAEHGLSFWLEYGRECWLLDAGQTDLFAKNAERLGIDLKRAKGAILSHGHYDHSGGFETLFQVNDRAMLHLQKSCRERCFHVTAEKSRYIGLPDSLTDRWRERMVFEEETRPLSPGLWLLPHSAPGLARRGERSEMYREWEGQMLPDDFAHEQSLVLETERGLVLLNSCSHGGIDTAVEEALSAFPGQRVYAVLGGFHLGLRGLT